MTSKVPLERPALPSVPTRLDWPARSVAVFGSGAARWASALRESLVESGRPARILHADLRHAAGYSLAETEEGVAVHAHPDALLEALRDARARSDSPAITVGVGAPYAVAVVTDVQVWIRGGATLRSLPATLRPIAAEATLVLEEPRCGVARELARSR